MMDTQFPYFVIRFVMKESMYHKFLKPFIAVPASWISPTVSRESLVAVHLPEETYKRMEERVICGHKVSKEWTLFFGTIVKGIENVSSALKYARFKNAEEQEINRRIRQEKRWAMKKAEYDYDQLSKPSTSATHKQQKLSHLKKKDESHAHKKIKFMKHLSEMLKYQKEQLNTLRKAANDLAPITSDLSNTMRKAIIDVKEYLKETDGEEDDNATQKIKNTNPRRIYEYPENSDKSKKWTLKFPEFQRGPDRVELMPGSGIFVGKDKLKECIESSKDSSELARSLVYEVFSNAAIRKCDVNNLLLEEGLDNYALFVLEKFVKEFDVKKQPSNY